MDNTRFALAEGVPYEFDSFVLVGHVNQKTGRQLLPTPVTPFRFRLNDAGDHRGCLAVLGLAGEFESDVPRTRQRTETDDAPQKIGRSPRRGCVVSCGRGQGRGAIAWWKIGFSSA